MRRSRHYAIAIVTAFLIAMLVTVGAAQENAGQPRNDAVRADYGPALGLQMRSAAGRVELGVPAGALDERAVFAHESIAVTGPAIRAVEAFRLTAHSMDGRQIRQFKKPLRLSVRYDEAALAAAGVSPARLSLFFRDDRQVWQQIPSTVDTDANAVTAELTHFTEFVVGETTEVRDSFDRVDSQEELGNPTSESGHNYSGVTDTGQVWQTDGSTWGVCGNAGCTIGPDQTGNYVRVKTASSAQRVAVTILPRAAGAAGQAGLVVAMTPDWASNLLYIGVEPSGVVEVWTLVGSTWSDSPIASGATGLDALSARRLEATIANNSLTVTLDAATAVGPLAVPAVSADAVYAGVFADTTFARDFWPRYDDFVAAPY